MEKTVTRNGIIRQPYMGLTSKRFAVRTVVQVMIEQSNRLNYVTDDLKSIVDTVNGHSKHLNKIRGA